MRQTQDFFSARRMLLRAASSIAVAPLALPAFAKSSASTIKIIVGYPPGGLVDAIARMLAHKLEGRLKRTVIVENRPGAGARVAATLFKRMPADGSHLMLATDSLMAQAPHVFNKLGFDVFQDFTPVTTVSTMSYVLATGTDPKLDSLKALNDWLHKNPGKSSFGHPGAGTAPHFFGMLLSDKIGVQMIPVPYQGGAPLLVALAGGGQISCGINALASDMLEFHRSGRIRIQAVTGESRSLLLPDVPTFNELGYPSVARGWTALYLPPGASKATVEYTSTALKEVLDLSEARETISGFGMQPMWSGAENLAKIARDDYQAWKPIIEKSGFKLDI